MVVILYYLGHNDKGGSLYVFNTDAATLDLTVEYISNNVTCFEYFGSGDTGGWTVFRSYPLRDVRGYVKRDLTLCRS